MADADIDGPVSNFSDSSFVILGQGSLPPSGTLSPKNESNSGSLVDGVISSAQNVCFNLSTTTKDETKKSSDESNIFDNDTQGKLSQLLKENYQLKETLNQNNLAIKSQLDTFVMWQQEVLKTHETHRQKFLETKNLILKLRAENGSLKEQLQDGLQRSSIADTNDFQYLESIENGLVKPNEFKQEVDGLKQNTNNYQSMCNELILKNEDLIADNSKLKNMLRQAKADVCKIGKELENVLMENKCLKESNIQSLKNPVESFNHSSLPNADARAQISNLFKQLEQEREKVKKLQKELEEVKSKTSTERELQLSTTDEMMQYINKLDDMNASFNKQSQRFNTINSWVSLAEQNFGSLKSQKEDKGVDCLILSEIAEFKNHLHEKENSFKQKQESLQEIQQQFQKLLRDYEELQHKFNIMEANGVSVEECRNEITRLNEQLKSKDEALMSKEQECNKLNEDFKKQNVEDNEVDLLRLQVQLYQTDFNDERAAREKLVGEKEELAEHIRFLEGRIKDLEQRKDQNPSESTSSKTTEKNPRYVCPKCMDSFSDLSRCQMHIDECLNFDF